MGQHFIVSFEDGGAVEFARLMKAIREETGFQSRLLQVEGRFPKGGPEVIKLFIEVDDYQMTAEEFRQKVSSYVPQKKDQKKGKKETVDA